MSTDTKFIQGLMFKPPHERAPEYVIAKGSIKRDELISWLEQQDGEWVNFDVKRSQQGKLYAAVDDWKPNQAQRGGGSPSGRQRTRAEADAPQEPAGGFNDDDIPFATNRGTF